jgi:hypothetical protein
MVINIANRFSWIFLILLLSNLHLYSQKVNLIDKLKNNKISIIEINTSGGAQIVSKEDYLTASYTLYTYKNGAYTTLSDYTEIKGRGNSTWNWPKKPFRLKLKSAKSLLSMPSSRHWALMANFIDKSLSRNKVAMDVGGFWGLPYNPRSDVVELVVNGWHWGSYQLIEVPKVANDRINITAINSKSGTPSGGVIFELDGRLGEQYSFWTNQYQPITIKDPDDLNTSNPSIASQHLSYLSNIFRNAEDVLFSDNFTDPINGYPKYIDTSSVYSWYLTQEIFKNIDLSRYSVFFYNDPKNSNKITFGPLWDFDMSSGILEDPYGIRGTENLWISRMYDDPAFLNAVKKKWISKRASLLQFITRKINENARKLHYSQQINFDFWNQFYGVISDEYVTFHQEKSYDDDIFYLKKWMNQRLFWLDQQFATVPHSFIPVTRDSYHIFNEDSELKGKLESFQSFDHKGKYKIVSGPKNGKLKLDETSGEYTYLPNTNYYGLDTTFFIYNDGFNNSDSGLLHFEIQPVNDLPVTINGAFEMKEDESIEKSNTTGLIMYASDPELDPLTFELVTNVKHGELVLNTSGSFKYIPEKNYYGSDTFYFKAKELKGSSNISYIIFKIQPVNDAPVAFNKSFTMNEDETLQFYVNSNKSLFADDIDGDSLIFEYVSSPFNGQLQSDQTGNIKYIPNLNFYGTDSIYFKVKDTGLNSNIATISFLVNPVNDAPVILDSIYYFQLKTSDQVSFDANSSLYNFITDIDNSKLDLKILPTKYYNTKGDVYLSNNGVYNYKPNPNANGLDSLKIKVLDLFSNSNEVKVIFRVLNNNQSVNSDNILLFPNPVTSFIRLKNLDVDQIFIYNIYGSIYSNIQFSKVGRDIVINCAQLPKGEYTIKLMSKNMYIGTKKFIKLF